MVRLFSWRKDVDKSAEGRLQKRFTMSGKKNAGPAAEAEAEPGDERQPREDEERYSPKGPCLRQGPGVAGEGFELARAPERRGSSEYPQPHDFNDLPTSICG